VSVKVMSLVWEHFGEGGSLLLGMLALADYSNDEGLNIYPSVPSFGRKIRCLESQARRILHKLIETGHIEVINNPHGGAPGSTRHYRINLERLTAGANATPGMNATPVTDARSSRNARGVIHARRRVSSMRERGVLEYTQTTIEPSMNHQSLVDSLAADRLPAGRLPDCPHQEIIKLYEQHLPMLARPRKWEGKRRAWLKARWIECSKVNGISQGYNTLQDGLAFWEGWFEHVAKNTTLPRGFDDRATGRHWEPDLEWLVKDENFTKIVEGKFSRG
jgi:hypothetical protein